jgi:hypothetical protein
VTAGDGLWVFIFLCFQGFIFTIFSKADTQELQSEIVTHHLGSG